MTYIYKPKKGMIGRIYYKFMKYIITSKYIDLCIVFSSSECAQYANLFHTTSERFVYIPLGEDIQNTGSNIDFKPNFAFASGFSNRDFDFLIDIFKELPYELRIYGDKKYSSNNIIMTDEIVGSKLMALLQKCRIVLIPLKEDYSSGQLTVLHAMEAGVPVIATKTMAMKDYIVDGENGYLLENNKECWKRKIIELYDDELKYKQMSNRCKEIYTKFHTLQAMGKNIGKFFINRY